MSRIALSVECESGETQADNHGHRIVRAVLLGELFADPDVRAAFAAADVRIGRAQGDEQRAALDCALSMIAIQAVALEQRLRHREPQLSLAWLINDLWNLFRVQYQANRTRQAFNVGIVAAPPPANLPRGRQADKWQAALERDARWFYRARVRGESIRQLAVEHGCAMNRNSDDCRKDVADGIKRAVKLLSVPVSYPTDDI